MSNTTSDNLHKLIKSLNKPEKRYFKLFSSRHSIGDENNYQILFDAIDKQDEYDEEKLLKKFKDKRFIHRFSIAKNRLYASILKSLDAFHSMSSIEAQLHRQLHSAEILYHKSLYDQSLKLFHSAKKVALAHEKWSILQQIRVWEKKIWEKNQYEDFSSETELSAAIEEDKKILRHIEISNDLWELKSRLFLTLYRSGKARNADDMHTLKEQIDLMLTRHQAATSVEAKYLMNHIQSAYYFGIGEYALSYPYLIQNLKWIEKEKLIFQEEPGIYLSALTNAIYVGMRLGKWKESQKLVDRLANWKLPEGEHLHEDLQHRLFALRCSTELTLCAQSGDFTRGMQLLPEMLAGIKKHEPQLSSVRKAHLYFHVAVIYFGAEKFNESLKWTNKLLNDVAIDKTKDIYCMAQLFNLIIHLELKNDDLLPYALRSTQRFLQTRNKSFQVEEVMLAFINNTQKKRAEKGSISVFEQLAASLAPLREHPFERSAFEYFDFYAWAKSKASGITFKEAVKPQM